MDIAEAAENFRRSTRHCDNLVAVHQRSGGSERGFRDEEVSVNRAIVVLTVASWQTVIQDLTLACVDVSAPPSGGALTPQSYAVLAGRVRKEVGDFATPNAQNTRRLMVGAGFDPRPHWTWSQGGGRGIGRITWTPQQADDRINQWLSIRHAIAHGHAVLPAVQALQVVRQAGSTPPADPVLRLVDAKQCLVFFRRLARLTGNALSDHLGSDHAEWA